MDYSGEIYGNEHNHPEGLSSGSLIGIGSLIQLTVYNYDRWGIKGWANQVFSARNYDNAVNGVTRFFDSLYSSFKSLFGSSPKTQAHPIATPQFSNYQSTTGWQEKGFNNITVNNGVNDLAHRIQEKHTFFNRLRAHYEGKSGKEFSLSKKEFDYLIKKGKIDYNNFTKVGPNRYETTINFYDSDKDLALSFGRATVSYKVENERLVFDGFYDRYDFDSKKWGVRSTFNEILTRTYNTISDGKSFNINYNYNYAKSYSIHYNLNVFDDK